MAGVGIGYSDCTALYPSSFPREGCQPTADLHEPAIARSKAYLPSVNGFEHGEARGRHSTVARLAVAVLAAAQAWPARLHGAGRPEAAREAEQAAAVSRRTPV